MKLSCIAHGLALAAALALSSFGAFAASGELHALSESEMAAVYGRGLSEPTLSRAGRSTAQEQSGSGLSATDALAALGAIAGDGTQTLDRQLTQQRLQAGATASRPASRWRRTWRAGQGAAARRQRRDAALHAGAARSGCRRWPASTAHPEQALMRAGPAPLVLRAAPG